MTDNPNSSVYEQVSTFICGSGGCNVAIDHLAKPEREIAGNYLEEIGSWMAALDREQAPARVMFAARAAYDAALWWVTDLDKPRPKVAPDRPRNAG